MTVQRLTPDNAHRLTHLRRLGEPPRLRNYEGQWLGFDPGSRFLFSVARGEWSSLKWWNLADPTELSRVHVPLYNVWTAVVAPSGDELFSVTRGGIIQRWSLLTGKMLRRASLRQSTLSISLSPRGDVLLLAGYKQCWLWDVHRWRLLRKLEAVPSRLECCAVSPDGTRAVAAGHGGVVYVWDIATGTALAPVPVRTDCIWDVAFHPSHPWLAVGTDSDRTCLIDLERREVVRVLKAPTSGAWSMHFSPDGALLASSFGSGFIVSDVREGTRLFGDYDTNDMQASRAVFSPDGRFVAWGRGDATVGLWGVEDSA